MTEDDLFEAFMAISAKRRAQHESNLHRDCTGCKVGLRWTELEDLKLISLLEDEVNLMWLSKDLDRPIWGIAARLQKLGIISKQQGCYRPNFVVFKRNKVTSDSIHQALVDKGWYIDNSILKAPIWWIRARIKTGK